MRTATMSSAAAPWLRLTPRRVISTPSPISVQRGRVSPVSSASTTTGSSPLDLRSQCWLSAAR
jgi:hypothetical protein